MATGKFIAYYRVSTDRQGRSGLGLAAQREAVETYLNGSNWRLVTEFTEVESGKRDDRPKLEAALKECRIRNAKLIVAKLDRLARNVAFISRLMDSGVDFVAADLPEANRLTIHILAAMAEYEREQISKRTKAALAAAKTRGVKLGNPQNATEAGRAKGINESRKVRTSNADQFAERLLDTILDIQDGGTTDHRGMAMELNEREITTPRGGQWQAAQVWRVCQRLEAMGHELCH